MDFCWPPSLVIAQDTVQRRVAKDLLTPPPRSTLPEPTELRQVGVELGQEPPAFPLLVNRIFHRWWITGKKRGEAPAMTRQLDRTFDSGRHWLEL